MVRLNVRIFTLNVPIFTRVNRFNVCIFRRIIQIELFFRLSQILLISSYETSVLLSVLRMIFHCVCFLQLLSPTLCFLTMGRSAQYLRD
jgi:uncharacterized membrane protein YobD (UPF0266 family)